MINQQYIDSLVGWSIGYQFTLIKNKEDEIKQGKNYYLSSFCVAGQLFQLGTLISKTCDHFPQHSLITIPVKVLCNVIPLLSIPSSLFCAMVKQGNHKKFISTYNQSRYCYIRLPEKLSGKTVSVLSFLAEHSGDMIRVTMIASSAGLMALGYMAYGGAVLASISYQAIDQMGLVPRRISLFMEVYMPNISLVGSLIGGTAIVRVFSAVVLSNQLMPQLKDFIHKKIDEYTRHYFGKKWNLSGPSLKEIEAPLVQKNQMTFDEIQEILDSNLDDYEINPAFCSKPVMSFEDLPRNKNYDKILPLFDEMDWQSQYSLITAKLKDDERFIDFLFAKYPTITKEDLAKNVEFYIQELAEQDEVTPEEYATQWIRKQLAGLVDVLQGKKRVKGFQQDLDEVLDIFPIILHHLSSLDNQIEQEDILLKLAIEGGNYCARGIKRTTNEILWGILQNNIQQEEDDKENMNQVQTYELKLRQALQNQRMQIFQYLYDAVTKQLGIPQDITKDVHGMDAYRLYLSLGFLPLTKFEKNRFGLSELMCWEMYSKFRQGQYSAFKHALDDATKEVGEFEFSSYFVQMIQENELLTDDEKTQVIETLTDCKNGQWSIEETLERFHRIAFVKLGVLVPVAKKDENMASENSDETTFETEMSE